MYKGGVLQWISCITVTTTPDTLREIREEIHGALSAKRRHAAGPPVSVLSRIKVPFFRL